MYVCTHICVGVDIYIQDYASLYIHAYTLRYLALRYIQLPYMALYTVTAFILMHNIRICMFVQAYYVCLYVKTVYAPSSNRIHICHALTYR